MIEQREQSNFMVVGLGASAGGVQALQQFFAHVPAESGMAYVVILHLSPDHDSELAGVLQVVSSIPVVQVHERVQVRPDCVYVVSPNHHLTMEQGELAVSVNIHVEERRAPVDIFFRTLAEAQGANAVCVVLSGSGANGSMGLKRIKEKGGAAFVQNPREAEFNEMPRNAIATDLVDEVLPVAEIPAKIIAYQKSMGTLHIPLEAEQRPEDQQHALREIFTQLRIRTGHDFSTYKRPTLLRRIERRINIRNLPNLTTYSLFIQQNPDEINALLKDLLISVTNFFRDKRSFDFISQEVLPAILQDKRAEDQVRLWVAGCATGEEAYSLAMLLAEQTLSVIDAPKIQIFATDIDETAISIAREGYYTVNDAADVSPERLRRFFNKEGEGYRIRREIRELILFANHNFIKDPPFSHLDMVSCRNVLIYLNRSAQERVMETFHFALNAGGYLFLGSSESADGSSDLYTSFNREEHIFQSRKKLIRTFPVPESVPTFRIEQPRLSSTIEQEHLAIERITFGDLHQRLIEEYAPPSLVINEEYDIVHLSERAGRYLQIAGGELSQNLLKLVRQELRLELRSALYQALQRQTAIEIRGLKVLMEDHTETVNIHIRPVLQEGDLAKGYFLIVFEPSAQDETIQEVVLMQDEPVARHLEEELLRLKAQLRASIEQHEFHAEELKASNEELQAMNEELRSAAEELETSKEELQSINEELRTVNQELKVKIEETSLTSNNLQNLINSASIGTIFLDRSFRIALFTPAVRDIFNLIPADYGRPLSDITHRLDYHGLLTDAEAVLEKLHTIEREVSTTDDRHFMMRVLPYRTAEDHINGVVITFFDITTRKRTEESLLLSEERYRVALSSAGMAAWDWNITQDSIVWNEQHYTLLGLKPDKSAKTSGFFVQFVHPEDKAMVTQALQTAIDSTGVYRAEFRIIHADDGQTYWMSGYGRVVEKINGQASRMIGVMYDISEHKQLEKQKDEFLGIASHELKTPVTGIKAYTELLLNIFEKAGNEEYITLMQKLDGQVDRLTDLIRALLDATRIAEEQLPLRAESFNMNEMIKANLETLQQLTPKHRFVFHAGELKPLVADRERITQVLTNLVSNAIKYSPDGGEVTITSKDEGDKVTVTIRDRGIGIPEDMQYLVFERFFRIGHAQVNTFPGIGLGLYISAGIVHRHGGTIWVESKHGQGSLFSFSIPYVAIFQS
ncbi:CheR family methyltransferase [Paraflavitalea sp. CAU 1676]|uniref:CheR family methyltransferase n=1 Tax=Paraflavitalea sp. CAU 1676 TaxID=3032598 RepID=UPI0023DCD8FC|nr:CheR family methyltransferase [Paraflavitalea sp. CAU 1676]MDF2191206.1 chemotaxis protein CheB [Paraflavitalea sp. CAU 1676]